ncbi:hypothetical protein O181_029262 [Austropuccinia psidii MF-1]|uniref:Uncharacterized protein n=1 Tax=Austropuccinia psidii MF-1 TaxID=1389203 RepID=A0A9Q3CTH0_9BASI|nr:hypothetical protein [Austropuccinia psidii MF-1]
MVNIEPRIIMENKDITKQKLQDSKIGIRKLEKDLYKELIKGPKEESDTYLPKKLTYFISLHPRRIQYSKNIFRSPKQKGEKKIQPSNKAIKQNITSEKESDINKIEDPIKQKPKDSTNTRNNIEQDFIEKHPQ